MSYGMLVLGTAIPNSEENITFWRLFHEQPALQSIEMGWREHCGKQLRCVIRNQEELLEHTLSYA